MPYRVRQQLKAEHLRMYAAQYQSLSAQSIVNNTNTKVTVATVMHNYGGVITLGTSNTLTLNKTGLWALSGGLQGSTVSNSMFAWVGNGASTTTANRYCVANQNGMTNAFPVFSLYREIVLSAGATVSLYVWHNHGSNRDVSATGDLLPYLSARYLGDG